VRNAALDHVQTRLSPVGQGRLPERPPPALMLGLQPAPELELDVLIHLSKMLSGVEPVKVSGPPAQDRIELVQLLFQRGKRVAIQDRLHLVPYPLHRTSRRPAVAEAPLGLATRGLFPKVHPQKVEAIPSRDDAGLVLIDRYPQPR
jgi:hypothetical protein